MALGHTAPAFMALRGESLPTLPRATVRNATLRRTQTPRVSRPRANTLLGMAGTMGRTRDEVTDYERPRKGALSVLCERQARHLYR
jgi:hypothetical protein